MSSILQLTDANFDATVGTGVALVDFYAPWCGPCKMQGPILEKLLPEYDDKVTVVKVDIDESPSIAASYGVQSIPTIVIFKDGKVVDTMVGLQRVDVLKAALDKVL